MSIENIKAMKSLLEQMRTMENKIKEENNKDIHSLRIKAMKKIFSYLSEVAEALDGEECCVYLDKEIIFKYNNANILFNSSVKKENYKWYISYYDNIVYKEGMDPENSNKEGLMNLIKNWGIIKKEIERQVNKTLSDRIERIKKDSAAIIKNYEKVSNFEV